MTTPRMLVAALLAASTVAAAALPEYRQQGGLAWVCAGVGADERRALEGLRSRADLEIVFVSAQRGAYLAGIEWTLRRPDGSELLRATADGPVCFVDAAPGRYKLEARLGETRRSATGTVAAASRKATRLVVAFPDEPWDGIRASPEEKAQAAAP